MDDIIPSDSEYKGRNSTRKDIFTAKSILVHNKQHHERFCQKFLVHICTRSEMGPYFAEFENCTTDAAQITHEVDSLECRIQAGIYIRRYPQLRDQLRDFFEPPLQPVYLSDLTSLLLREEMKETRSDVTIIFVIGTSTKTSSSYLLTLSGGPGVGKDTQCNRLIEEFKFCHIPTGELLREEVKRPDSRYSKFIEESMDLGFNVPAELMISLLIAVAKGDKWILNGFPRSLDQLLIFEQLVISTVLCGFYGNFLFTL